MQPRRSLSGRRLFQSLESRQLLATGDLDVTFGGDGLVSTDDGVVHNAADIAIQRDGRIVVVAGTVDAGEGEQDRFVVVRSNRNGSLDKTFSGDGSIGSTAEVQVAVRAS